MTKIIAYCFVFLCKYWEILIDLLDGVDALASVGMKGMIVQSDLVPLVLNILTFLTPPTKLISTQYVVARERATIKPELVNVTVAIRDEIVVISIALTIAVDMGAV